MTPSRRGVVAGTLTLFLAGPVLAQSEELPADLKKNPELDKWLRLSADGKVLLRVGKVELGQGVLTAYAQMCADELDVALDDITVQSGDTIAGPNQGLTAGSQSMPDGGAGVRGACAEARAVLLDMASKQLAVPIEKLSTANGAVSGGGKTVSYAALLGGKRIERQAAGVAVRSYRQPRLVGQPVPRIDLRGKLTGAQAYVQDLRPEGMLNARVVRPPSPAASLLEAPTAIDGAQVIRSGSFLAVVAPREWAAIKASRALAEAARWSAAPIAADDVHAWLKSHPAQTTVIKDQPRTGLPPARTVKAAYSRHYLMHGSIGPSCAVAVFADGMLTVDTHSQSVFETGAAIAKLVGLEPAKVHMRHSPGAGCYGHNGADDAAAEAALIAMAVPGSPIRLQWMRDEEHGFEPYGSPMIQEISAAVDAQGDVLDWSMDLWSGSHLARPVLGPGAFMAGPMLEAPIPAATPINPGPPSYGADRNGIPGYAFPGQKVTTHFLTAMPVRVSSLRSLGAHGNVFAIESFMDELALAAGTDPLAYRLRALTDPRGREVLQRAADSFGWTRWKKAPGRGRGLAYARYKNFAAYCAVCIEVEATADKVKLVRAVVAADAGQVVNPDGLANQLEGGLLQGLSWSLIEQVAIAEGQVASRDWASYPILKITKAPAIKVEIVNRATESLGAGECAAGPSAAALANALFDATGSRDRALPLRPSQA